MAPVFHEPAPGEPSREEREQRIAALRHKRASRLRFLALRAVIVAGALGLVLVVALYWLLTTVGGREFLMAQIVQRLPDNASLTWEAAEGPASGPLTLHGVHFSWDGIEFDAQRVHLDPALGPLLGRRLRLDALQVEQARLDLPVSDEPFQLPRWPDSLPAITPPLALEADDIRVDGLAITREGAPVIDIARLRGGLVADDGRLHIEHLAVDSDRGVFGVHGDYVPAEDYRTDLVATAVLPADSAGTPARVGLVARGDLARMDVAVAGRAPGPFRATLVLRGDDAGAATVAGAGDALPETGETTRERPRWELRADARALQPGLLTGADAATDGAPIALQLEAGGTGGDARLRGEVTRGDFHARVLPSIVHLEDQVLRLDPLHLALFDGTVLVRGQADFNDPGNADFRFAANARDLRWGGSAPAGTPAPPVIEADADFGLAGTMQAWALVGDATLTRDGEQAQLRLDGRGDQERMRLETLHVAMPTGTLDVDGSIAWAPSLGWDVEARLAGFDPGYFVAGWDGAVRGRVASTGHVRDDGGLEVAVQVPELGGRLRGRPLEGEGRFAMHGAADADGIGEYEGELSLGLGGSRVTAEGRYGRRIDIDARLAPLRLADLLPDAAGTLRGTVQVSGARDAPDIAADLDGDSLRYGDWTAASLRVDGELPWSGGGGTLSIDASGLQAGVALDRLSVDATGAVEDLELQARAEGGVGTLALSGHHARAGNGWRGRLATLQLEPARGPAWHLLQPAEFRWSNAGNTLSAHLEQACLASTAAGSLCASADWPRGGLEVHGEGLPLSLVAAYLPESEDGRPWELHGEVALDARVRPSGNGWTGGVRLSSAAGGLRTRDAGATALVEYRDLQLTADFRPQGIEAELAAVLDGDGHIDARLATGWDAWSPLDGEISIDTDELTWMELLSPDIVAPSGRLSGRITLAGTRAEPQLGGRAQLVDFEAGLPALAIELHEGRLQLETTADGRARITGQVRTASASGGTAAGGVLHVDGNLGWGEDATVQLNVRGDRVLVSDTVSLHAVASPDLTVSYNVGEPLQVTGQVAVPEAHIDLERLDRGVSVSPDVVVLDPVDPEAGPATPLAMDLVVVVGDDVTMDGFGLEGSVDGRIRIVSRPGREMLATGHLDVAGEYTAYGQDLRITRGRLSWSGDPIANPFINLRAERVIGEVTAGVDVSGRATAPEAEVWANPASSQSEALAYLTLGRPLSGLTSSERGDINAASAALTAGGSLLASQLGTRLGLDDAGVMQSRALGSVFGFGKQLSPRLYVSYGVSLLGTGQVLLLKYLLGHGFDIEIESSSVENRALLNWRKEK